MVKTAARGKAKDEAATQARVKVRVKAREEATTQARARARASISGEINIPGRIVRPPRHMAGATGCQSGFCKISLDDRRWAEPEVLK
jgi:hypothetical protein